MACPDCQRRSALIAALATAISRLSLNHESLLELLALPNTRLLRAAKVENPDEVLRGLQPPLPTERVPTALCRHDYGYPEVLRQLPCAPAVLYATCTTGRLRELLTAPTVAIVGSRTPTDYARQMASALAHDLATAGVTVISGMNTGLEGTVHQHGNSIAVMPDGPEIPHPSENNRLHESVLVRGAAVSEYPPGFSLRQGWSFIANQRIIAALASVIVVAEAGGRSCAILTAKIGSDLGADVAVVPGRVTDPGGPSLFALLRDGAHPVARAEDVLGLF
jgi:DNA processing protein